MDELTKSITDLRAQAIEQNQAFGVTRLRDQFKMKPKPGAEPVRWVKSPYSRGRNPVYLVADCEPLAARQQNQGQKTEAQIAGLHITKLKNSLRSSKNRFSRKLDTWLTENWHDIRILDTETTGLDGSDQVIELAILDMDGVKLFERRFRPSVEINPFAQQVHQISAEKLADCGRWSDSHNEIETILAGKQVVIFNQAFDIRLMKQTAVAFGCPTDCIEALQTHCVMVDSVKAFAGSHCRTLSAA